MCAVAWWLTAAVAHGDPIKPAAAAPGKTEPPKEWAYDAKGKRDPFIPLVKDGRVVSGGGDTTPGSHPILIGILWDPGGHSIALINDSEAKVGDTVNGYLVTEIRRDEVVLLRDSERTVLRISFEETKSPAPAGARPAEGGRP